MNHFVKMRYITTHYITQCVFLSHTHPHTVGDVVSCAEVALCMTEHLKQHFLDTSNTMEVKT